LTAVIRSFRGPAGEALQPLGPSERLARSARGSYLLVVKTVRPISLAVGRLGDRELTAGTYVYCGSALGGLAGRIARHRRSEKRLHWHVDYLLEHARIVEVWFVLSDTRLECVLARHLASFAAASRPIPGFGSSDCRCPGHLIRWADQGRRSMREPAKISDDEMNVTDAVAHEGYG
jgi:Uri superfamily endonuclease